MVVVVDVSDLFLRLGRYSQFLLKFAEQCPWSILARIDLSSWELPPATPFIPLGPAARQYSPLIVKKQCSSALLPRSSDQAIGDADYRRYLIFERDFALGRQMYEYSGQCRTVADLQFIQRPVDGFIAHIAARVIAPLHVGVMLKLLIQNVEWGRRHQRLWAPENYTTGLLQPS